MSARNGLFLSASVSEGHPDKIADRISDAVLDEFLRLEPTARVACETLLADQCVEVAGEFKTRDHDAFRQARERAAPIVAGVQRIAGYRDSATGIDPERGEMQMRFNGQSADINRGVGRVDGLIGAGDQGLMSGYACDETPELMPAPIVYAHQLIQCNAELCRSGALTWLQPDAKSEVSFRFEEGRPVAIEAVVLATQHAEDVDTDTVRPAVKREVIDAVISLELRVSGYSELKNPTGRFVTGGPKGDTGLTGRKIIPDTYGGAALHGGGALAGKHLSKVEPSATYNARFLAKQVMARGWAPRRLVQLAYVISVAEAVSTFVDAEGTSAARDA